MALQENSIIIESPGVYFFRSGVVSTQINQDLVVTLFTPDIKATGIVLFNHVSDQKRLIDLLESVWKEIQLKSKSKAKDIIVKCFGLSIYHPEIVESLQSWLKEKNLIIKAQDLGKNVSRVVSVYCETGRVGISYAEKVKEPQHPKKVSAF